MRDFWFSETDFVVPVELSISRRNRFLGHLTTGQPWDEQEKQTVQQVRWKQSANVHEISYRETPENPNRRGGSGSAASPLAASDEPPNLTICRLEPTTLTWQRHGGVEWEHIFETGDVRSSLMTVPGIGSIEVKLRTRSLRIEVGPTGGLIDVAYDMTMSDVTQYIELSMRFTRT
ncbi:DUF1934 domain-containing protein [Alicyclobacillus ferrooxydans]|uniref:Uncharacterized protein n=1 Tax=Alicyclobacillus ferrooxydans TaxID=471514 RepID=A0A0P9D008_9BACL|nr:DUF1934 domain-containing protein [Alicyclobacillus ferrooxydans]KPV42772.1 hypothetical protein AN477_15610 [Alicyclobacillus ferrooxydans]